MIHLDFIATVAPILAEWGFALYPFEMAPGEPGERYATWQTPSGVTTQTLDHAYMDDARIQLNLSVVSTDDNKIALKGAFDALDENPEVSRISPHRLLDPEEADPYETWSADFRVY